MIVIDIYGDVADRALAGVAGAEPWCEINEQSVRAQLLCRVCIR